MKDYRSIFEFQRRKEEFSKYYSASYDTSGFKRFLEDCHQELLEVFGDSEAAECFRKEVPYYLPVFRVLALCSYVHRYCSIEYAIHNNLQNDQIEEFSQLTIDEATMTSGEIYDYLKSLLPSYSEALLSFVDNAGMDVRERLLDFLLNNDKQSFISILQNERGNAYRLSHLCKIFKDNEISNLLHYNMKMVDFVEENEISIRDMPIEEFKEGESIAKILDLIKLQGEDEDEWNEIKKVIEQDAYQLYKLAVIKYIVAANGMLSENQKDQYQELLHADGIAQWYDKAYEECQNELSEEESVVEPVVKELEELKLPEDFLTSNKYIDNKIPYIRGLVLPHNNEQLLKIVDMLAEHHCIGNDNESKYKFIRAYTGRSLNPNDEFEKAYWSGTCPELLHLIKHYTPGVYRQYRPIPELFQLNPKEEELLQRLLSDTKSISSYADRGGGHFLEYALNSIFPCKR